MYRSSSRVNYRFPASSIGSKLLLHVRASAILILEIRRLVPSCTTGLITYLLLHGVC
jgi:hypothetical protein